jgi:Ca-activated chloride channel family protein
MEEFAIASKDVDAIYPTIPNRSAYEMYDQSMSAIRMPLESLDRENYLHFDNNPVKRVVEEPVSTFSIDVDTGSYSVMRRMINNGQLPRYDAVRSEEFINYFTYDYPKQAEPSAPFSVHKEISVTPWNPDMRLLHIGIKGYEQDREDLPPANLVFLVDVSGSMQVANKLELLKTSLKLLTRQLRKQDTVSLVVYAGASGVVLEPTSGFETVKIMTALDSLTAGGSTNGRAGV